MFEWVTVDDLAGSLGRAPAEPESADWAGKCVDAVNAFVARRRPDLTGSEWPESADVRMGALLLAQAMFQRRGVAGPDVDIYAYPARLLDANVSSLLGLGRPVIA